MQKHRFWTAKGLSLDGKSIGFEKVRFLHQKVHFSYEKKFLVTTPNTYLKMLITPIGKGLEER